MTIQKNPETLMSDLTLVAGEGNQIATVISAIQGHGTFVHRKITNGATGPTVQATIDMEVSLDNQTWFQFGTLLQGGTTLGVVTETIEEIPKNYPHIRIIAGGNTVQDVVVNVIANTIVFER